MEILQLLTEDDWVRLQQAFETQGGALDMPTFLATMTAILTTNAITAQSEGKKEPSQAGAGHNATTSSTGVAAEPNVSSDQSMRPARPGRRPSVTFPTRARSESHVHRPDGASGGRVPFMQDDLENLFLEVDYNGDKTVDFDEFTSFAIGMATMLRGGGSTTSSTNSAGDDSAGGSSSGTGVFRDYVPVEFPLDGQSKQLRNAVMLGNVDKWMVSGLTRTTVHDARTGRSLCVVPHAGRMLDSVFSVAAGVYCVSNDQNQLQFFDDLVPGEAPSTHLSLRATVPTDRAVTHLKLLPAHNGRVVTVNRDGVLRTLNLEKLRLPPPMLNLNAMTMQRVRLFNNTDISSLCVMQRSGGSNRGGSAAGSSHRQHHRHRGDQSSSSDSSSVGGHWPLLASSASDGRIAVIDLSRANSKIQAGHVSGGEGGADADGVITAWLDTTLISGVSCMSWCDLHGMAVAAGGGSSIGAATSSAAMASSDASGRGGGGSVMSLSTSRQLAGVPVDQNLRSRALLFHDSMSPHNASILLVHAIQGTHQVVTADASGIVKLWDARMLSCAATFASPSAYGSSHHAGPVSTGMGGASTVRAIMAQASYQPLTAMRVDEKHRRLLCLGKEASVMEYETRDSAKYAHDEPLIGVLFNPTTETFVSMTAREIRVWNATSGVCIAVRSDIADSRDVLSDRPAATLDSDNSTGGAASAGGELGGTGAGRNRSPPLASVKLPAIASPRATAGRKLASDQPQTVEAVAGAALPVPTAAQIEEVSCFSLDEFQGRQVFLGTTLGAVAAVRTITGRDIWRWALPPTPGSLGGAKRPPKVAFIYFVAKKRWVVGTAPGSLLWIASEDDSDARQQTTVLSNRPQGIGMSAHSVLGGFVLFTSGEVHRREISVLDTRTRAVSVAVPDDPSRPDFTSICIVRTEVRQFVGAGGLQQLGELLGKQRSTLALKDVEAATEFAAAGKITAATRPFRSSTRAASTSGDATASLTRATSMASSEAAAEGSRGGRQLQQAQLGGFLSGLASPPFPSSSNVGIAAASDALRTSSLPPLGLLALGASGANHRDAFLAEDKPHDAMPDDGDDDDDDDDPLVVGGSHALMDLSATEQDVAVNKALRRLLTTRGHHVTIFVTADASSRITLWSLSAHHLHDSACVIPLAQVHPPKHFAALSVASCDALLMVGMDRQGCAFGYDVGEVLEATAAAADYAGHQSRALEGEWVECEKPSPVDDTHAVVLMAADGTAEKVASLNRQREWRRKLLGEGLRAIERSPRPPPKFLVQQSPGGPLTHQPSPPGSFASAKGGGAADTSAVVVCSGQEAIAFLEIAMLQSSSPSPLSGPAAANDVCFVPVLMSATGEADATMVLSAISPMAVPSTHHHHHHHHSTTSSFQYGSPLGALCKGRGTQVADSSGIPLQRVADYVAAVGKRMQAVAAQAGLSGGHWPDFGVLEVASSPNAVPLNVDPATAMMGQQDGGATALANRLHAEAERRAKSKRRKDRHRRKHEHDNDIYLCPELESIAVPSLVQQLIVADPTVAKHHFALAAAAEASWTAPTTATISVTRPTDASPSSSPPHPGGVHYASLALQASMRFQGGRSRSKAGGAGSPMPGGWQDDVPLVEATRCAIDAAFNQQVASMHQRKRRASGVFRVGDPSGGHTSDFHWIHGIMDAEGDQRGGGVVRKQHPPKGQFRRASNMVQAVRSLTDFAASGVGGKAAGGPLRAGAGRSSSRSPSVVGIAGFGPSLLATTTAMKPTNSALTSRRSSVSAERAAGAAGDHYGRVDAVASSSNWLEDAMDASIRAPAFGSFLVGSDGVGGHAAGGGGFKHSSSVATTTILTPADGDTASRQASVTGHRRVPSLRKTTTADHKFVALVPAATMTPATATGGALTERGRPRVRLLENTTVALPASWCDVAKLGRMPSKAAGWQQIVGEPPTDTTASKGLQPPILSPDRSRSVLVEAPEGGMDAEAAAVLNFINFGSPPPSTMALLPHHTLPQAQRSAMALLLPHTVPEAPRTSPPSRHSDRGTSPEDRSTSFDVEGSTTTRVELSLRGADEALLRQFRREVEDRKAVRRKWNQERKSPVSARNMVQQQLAKRDTAADEIRRMTEKRLVFRSTNKAAMVTGTTNVTYSSRQWVMEEGRSRVPAAPGK